MLKRGILSMQEREINTEWVCEVWKKYVMSEREEESVKETNTWKENRKGKERKDVWAKQTVIIIKRYKTR